MVWQTEGNIEEKHIFLLWEPLDTRESEVSAHSLEDVEHTLVLFCC